MNLKDRSNKSSRKYPCAGAVRLALRSRTVFPALATPASRRVRIPSNSIPKELKLLFREPIFNRQSDLTSLRAPL